MRVLLYSPHVGRHFMKISFFSFFLLLEVSFFFFTLAYFVESVIKIGGMLTKFELCGLLHFPHVGRHFFKQFISPHFSAAAGYILSFYKLSVHLVLSVPAIWHV